jgi:ribosomal protein L37AE/L43A
MGWSITTHRCLRPTVEQVEKIGAGIGSVWRCATCRAAYRIVDFDISTSAGDFMQTSVRWEVINHGVVTR